MLGPVGACSRRFTRVAKFLCPKGVEHWGVVPESAGNSEDECAALCDAKTQLSLVDAAEILKGRALFLNKTAEVRRLLPPLPNAYPPAIFAAGLNYRKHAEETGLALPRFPVVVLLSPTSVCGPGDEIRIPAVAQDPLEVDYEVAGNLGPRVSHARGLLTLPHLRRDWARPGQPNSPCVARTRCMSKSPAGVTGAGTKSSMFSGTQSTHMDIMSTHMGHAEYSAARRSSSALSSEPSVATWRSTMPLGSSPGTSCATTSRRDGGRAREAAVSGPGLRVSTHSHRQDRSYCFRGRTNTSPSTPAACA